MAWLGHEFGMGGIETALIWLTACKDFPAMACGIAWTARRSAGSALVRELAGRVARPLRGLGVTVAAPSH